MIVLFLLLFFLTKKLYKNDGFTPSLIIVATFLISTIIGLLYYITERNEVYNYSFFSMLYYAVTLFVFLIPLIKHHGLYKSFSFPPIPTRYISIILIVLGLISLYSALKSFSFNEFALNWADIRSEYYKNFAEQEKAISILERIESNVSHILFICIPLAFYYFTKRNKKYAILLMMVSLTTLIESFRDAERQDILLWFANLLMSYFMFREGLSKKTKHVFSVVMITASSFVIIIIASITIARFGEGDSLTESLYNYSAMQPYNAAYFLENLSNQALWGRLNFPYIVGGGPVYMINDYINSGEFLNSFSSIVGSFYKDFGYYTLPFAALFAIFFNYILTISRKMHSLLYFYVYCLYFSIMFVGVFYNKYTSPPMIRIVIFFALLIVIFETLNKKKNERIRYNDVLQSGKTGVPSN